ncbi:energy transducer TonB [Oleiagrimonas sp. C23AA]|nr:energy transducer TonB [Oleiagrimonas sp. C23AA]
MILAIIAILVVLGVAAWFLIIKPNREAGAPAMKQSSASQGAPSSASSAPVNVASLTTDQLLAEARKALNDQRLLAPAGNNAFEFYLKVLERQPNNQVARDALRETFPFGANAAEQAINQRDFGEAQREIDLLSKADPENYTLTILRSKLDAQRKLQDHEQQAESDKLAQQKRQAAAQQAAAEQAAAAKASAQPSLAEAQAEKARQEAAAAAAQRKREQASAAKAPAKPAPVSIQDAVLTHQVKPRYPTAAVRSSQEGWVDVEFTVGTDGKVNDAHVVEAKPHHVFDRSAVDAVSKWRYKPALRNGKPMAVTMRRRIVFTLGRQR